MSGPLLGADLHPTQALDGGIMWASVRKIRFSIDVIPDPCKKKMAKK